MGGGPRNARLGIPLIVAPKPTSYPLALGLGFGGGPRHVAMHGLALECNWLFGFGITIAELAHIRYSRIATARTKNRPTRSLGPRSGLGGLRLSAGVPVGRKHTHGHARRARLCTTPTRRQEVRPDAGASRRPPTPAPRSQNAKSALEVSGDERDLWTRFT